MKLPRFTVRRQMILVALVAAALAACILSRPWWQSHQGMTFGDEEVAPDSPKPE